MELSIGRRGSAHRTVVPQLLPRGMCHGTPGRTTATGPDVGRIAGARASGGCSIRPSTIRASPPRSTNAPVQLLGRVRVPGRLPQGPRERMRTHPMTALPMTAEDRLETQVEVAREWFARSRFEGIVRLHTAREVAAQQGTIQPDYTVARVAAEAFYTRLRELFAEGRQITTFGPYSPGQAVVMKRIGLEAIYLGGWATSAKGSDSEDPGPDLASYPLSQVPDEAAGLVRALLTADQNQQFARTRMDEDTRRVDAGGRLPPVHHRRRRHRPWRRRARPEPYPAIRRGRRSRVSHRGPEAGRQEVRTPERQGPGRPGRAEQAAQCGAVAARHHASAWHHRREDRC